MCPLYCHLFLYLALVVSTLPRKIFILLFLIIGARCFEMVSQKRSQLLSEKEREKLTNRANLDKRTNSTNAIRVKRKLSAWLDNISDVVLILQTLPDDQLKDEVHDWYLYFLLNIVENLMEIEKFYPIEGDIEEPDEWKAVIKCEKKTEKKTVRPAEDLDIARASMLTYHIGILGHYLGMKNPIPKVDALVNACKNPNLPDLGNKLTPNERRAMERYVQAITKFLNDTVRIEEMPPK